MQDDAESLLTIDLAALRANYAAVAAEAQGAEVAPVVKADGYGLGAGVIGRALWAEGARSFFVARLAEGEALRRDLGDRSAVILVLDGAVRGSIPRLKAHDLTPVLSTAEQAADWRAADGPAAALHVDTGMNRLGVSQAEAVEIAASAQPIALVMSHLGDAASPEHPRNARQLERFKSARALFPASRASLGASAGAFLGPDYRFDMVRPGVSLYGGGPRERPDPRFHAVATLTSPLLQIRHIEAGEQVGYGSTFTAPRGMRVGLAGGGYADGVLRTVFGRATAWLGDCPAPILAVSMDMIAVDLTACFGAVVGDPIEFLGHRAKLDDLAAGASSVPHEVLVRLSLRARRVYLGEA